MVNLLRIFKWLLLVNSKKIKIYLLYNFILCYLDLNIKIQRKEGNKL